jgi:hypothetical protein
LRCCDFEAELQRKKCPALRVRRAAAELCSAAVIRQGAADGAAYDSCAAQLGALLPGEQCRPPALQGRLSSRHRCAARQALVPYANGAVLNAARGRAARLFDCWQKGARDATAPELHQRRAAHGDASCSGGRAQAPCCARSPRAQESASDGSCVSASPPRPARAASPGGPFRNLSNLPGAACWSADRTCAWSLLTFLKQRLAAL